MSETNQDNTESLTNTVHEVTLNVSLSEQQGGKRTWSCAMLAAVWQLLRLGLLSEADDLIHSPPTWEGNLPTSWDELPPVLALNSDTAPFTAYRTMSILTAQFLHTEHAVRTILKRITRRPLLDMNVEIVAAARAEGVLVPDRPLRRIEYVLLG